MSESRKLAGILGRKNLGLETEVLGATLSARRTDCRSKELNRQDKPAPCSHHWGGTEAEAGAMLVACRLVGLSVLDAHYAGAAADVQSGGCALARPLEQKP